MLADQLLAIAPIDQLKEMAVLVPIPLHVRRERQRGFNQSADIAQALSDLTGIQVRNLLHRQRSTMTQSHLPRELRQQNTSNAFTVIARSEATKESQALPRIIILIDDVATSGSTLSAAAKAMVDKSAVAQAFPNDIAVWAATVARG
jgi:ComF family protein